VKLFAAIACVAFAAGTAAWWFLEKPRAAAPDIAPAALWAATFSDPTGRPQGLGQFRGRILVANFWATWCGPCRDEIPLLVRAQ
jgi:thiol-disulfide isomerase/thioredoxin